MKWIGFVVGLIVYLFISGCLVLSWCMAASRPMPRPPWTHQRNRRGGRLGRWLSFHRSVS
jgi:hypothetical protein